MNGIDDYPHPKGDKWASRRIHRELDRAEGGGDGGSSSSGGCLLLAVAVALAALAIALLGGAG